MSVAITHEDLENFARTIDYNWRNPDDYLAYWSARCEGLVDDHTDENQVDEWVTNLQSSQLWTLGFRTDAEVADLVDLVDETFKGRFF